MELATLAECPECGRKLEAGAFQCPSCELILEGVMLDSIEPPREPTVIRMMLSPPEASLSRADIQIPPEVREAARERLKREVTAPTVLMTFLAASEDVPSVVDNLDLMTLKLSSFEAFAISMMDGRTNVDGVRQVAGLSKPEMNGLLKSLVDMGVVKITEAPRRPQRMARPVSAEDLGIALEAVEDEPPPPPPPPPVRPALAPLPPPKPVLSRTRSAPQVPAAPGPPPPAEPPAKPIKTSPAIEAFLGSAGKVKKAAVEEEGLVGSPLQRAIALEKAGNIDRAIEVLEQAINKSRDPAPLYNRLAIVLIKERRDLARAETYLAKARKVDPDNTVYEQNYFRVVALRAAD